MTSKQIQAKLTKLGLINEDGTPVLYSKFKNRATIHRYGQTSKKVVYFGVPKVSLFGFYPFDETAHDSVVLKDAYKNYVKLAKGNTEPYMKGSVKWSNGEIPSRYGSMAK